MIGLHDELVAAYLDYFDAFEKWNKTKSIRKYYVVQRTLRRIRDLATDHNRLMREEYHRITAIRVEGKKK